MVVRRKSSEDFEASTDEIEQKCKHRGNRKNIFKKEQWKPKEDFEVEASIGNFEKNKY